MRSIHGWRRYATGNQATKVPGDHGTKGPRNRGTRRQEVSEMYAGTLVPWIVIRGSGHGHSETSSHEDERGHAPRALEAPGGHIGDLSEVSLPDAGPPRLPDLRNLRGPRRH